MENLLQRITQDHINKRNKERMTALGLAVANKSDDCIQHILQCGLRQGLKREKIIGIN